MKRLLYILPLIIPLASPAADEGIISKALQVRVTVNHAIQQDAGFLDTFYKDLHAHPELSLQEEKTAAKVAAALRETGFEVTEKFGGFGLVGVFKNGPGPVLLVRTDLDGLPVLEETGLPYASKARAIDPDGVDVPVMHACGHDVHMTAFVGAARQLTRLKGLWSGTLVFIGQPAEERGLGAKAMLDAGLYSKFPKPDFALALHDSATLPAGQLGLAEGPAMANVDTVEITVRGIGGHGAYPHATKDPIVLASRIVVALQTIVSRETRPVDPAVVTVGSIHGGTKANIIPNEVKLQLTLRSYSENVRAATIAAVSRICRGEAIAAGIPENLLPIVTLIEKDFTPALINHSDFTRRVRGALTAWFGAQRVQTIEAEMGGEDFSRYGLTAEKVPICMFRLGAVAPEKIAESARTGVPLPSLHSSKFGPQPEPTLSTGVAAFTAVALDLLKKNSI